MVRIDYINGDSETVETIDVYDEFYGRKFKKQPFKYDSKNQCFIICDHEKDSDCMMIPREFVKSIRHIEV